MTIVGPMVAIKRDSNHINVFNSYLLQNMVILHHFRENLRYSYIPYLYLDIDTLGNII